MREVYSHQDITEVGFYQSMLEEADIATFVRNENTANPALSGAMFQPTLCVVEEGDYDEALRILKEHQDKVVAGAVEWTCPSCSEKNPPNFEVCWKCDTARPVS